MLVCLSLGLSAEVFRSPAERAQRLVAGLIGLLQRAVRMVCYVLMLLGL